MCDSICTDPGAGKFLNDLFGLRNFAIVELENRLVVFEAVPESNDRLLCKLGLELTLLKLLELVVSEGSLLVDTTSPTLSNRRSGAGAGMLKKM